MLPAKWHQLLLLFFYVGAVPVLWLSVTWLVWAWMCVLLVLNFTPCRGERWRNQEWIG